MNSNLFDQLDFGQFEKFINDDDVTDISYCNNGQIWIRSLTNGSLRIDNHGITNEAVEKLAFQCSNVMGTTFNTAKPFLDAESSELRMNFVHESVATNGIALVIRKTPAKIRLKEEKLLEDNYITKDIHDFLIKCVLGHCNIMVCGETGSGKTEFVKYLASHTRESEKIITIEDTLELHLDRIYPNRDIVAMKTNNIASYSDVLVTCMRQNPKWILLSEVRSAEAVSAVRNSISSGHNILSTIHSDKASAIPHRLYALMETDLDVDQFLNTIYRYVQLGVHIKAYYSKEKQKFHREIDEITEFYVDENNEPVYNVIYQRSMTGKIMKNEISNHLREYLENQNINLEVPVDSKNGLTSDLDELVEAQKAMSDKFSVKEDIKEEPINYIDSAINLEKTVNNDANVNNINNISVGGTTTMLNENVIPLEIKDDNSDRNIGIIPVTTNELNQVSNNETVENREPNLILEIPSVNNAISSDESITNVESNGVDDLLSINSVNSSNRFIIDSDDTI